LRARITTFTRSIKYHRPRGPFCLAGSCGQCLMRVDGVPSLPACRVKAQEGMACERQNGPLGVEKDLFRAADFLFPDGLDHHHLLTGSRLLGRVALEVARRLAGLGELPARVPAPVTGELRMVELAIVGGGPAGLAAARAAGARALLIEREARTGGAELLFGTEPQHGKGNAGLLLDAECVGLYANDTTVPGNALLAVRQGDRILAIVAGRVIVATGGVSQPLPFPGVDRPGVYAARGLLGLSASVGRKLAVVGDGDEQQRCAEALSKRGYDIVLVNGVPRRALGNPVKALDTADGTRIDALTVRDAASHCLLAVTRVRCLSEAAVKAACQRLFRRYGRPRSLLMDRGAPWCGLGPYGWTRLSVWWLRLGIEPRFTRRARPQDNAAHEQMHRMLKAATAQPPAPTARAQVQRFVRWRWHYNHARPHASLGERPPACAYRASPRRYPVALITWSYPAHWNQVRVTRSGTIRWHGQLYSVGRAFHGTLLGLRGENAVYLGPHLLGQLALNDGVLRPVRLGSIQRGRG